MRRAERASRSATPCSSASVCATSSPFSVATFWERGAEFRVQGLGFGFLSEGERRGGDERRERERKRETDRQTDRQRKRKREREKERQRERERVRERLRYLLPFQRAHLLGGAEFRVQG